MASIIFIAVQCCQCSTMQVKQRKKSSNKWTCVVCNQKQSVLKVFAQSFMAKDIRKVVQTFNMSRQLTDQNQSLVFDQQTLASSSPKELNTSNHNNKRTDWTEYIDHEDEQLDNHNDNDNAENMFDEMFVTELPKAVFKKPKLSDYSSSSSGKRNQNSYRPVFGKRSSSYKQLNSLDNEPAKYGETMADLQQNACTKQAADMFSHSNLLKHQLLEDKGKPLHAADVIAEKELMRHQSSKEAEASKWRDCIDEEDGESNLVVKAPIKIGQRAGASFKWTDYITEEDGENNFVAKAPSKLGQKTSASSKWTDYITEEDEDNADLMIQSEKNHSGQWSDVALCTTLYDQTAEDDIHPDFH